MSRQPAEIADELLVLRSQDGDRQAFQLLVGRWQKRLLTHAGQVTGRPDAAHEIVQDAWISVMRGLRRLKDPAAFRGWVYRIVHHRSVDWLRQQKSHRQAMKQLEHCSPCDTSGSEPSNENELLQLRDAIQQLTADDKLLLRMFYTDGMRIREIASALGAATGTIKYRLFRIRGHLKTMIDSETRIVQGDRHE